MLCFEPARGRRVGDQVPPLPAAGGSASRSLSSGAERRFGRGCGGPGCPEVAEEGAQSPRRLERIRLEA